MVLLKNSNKALPLSLDQLKSKKIALIGPTANVTVLMQSNYHGLAPYLTSPLMGFQTIIHGNLCLALSVDFIRCDYLKVIQSIFNMLWVVRSKITIRAVLLKLLK